MYSNGFAICIKNDARRNYVISFYSLSLINPVTQNSKAFMTFRSLSLPQMSEIIDRSHSVIWNGVNSPNLMNRSLLIQIVRFVFSLNLSDPSNASVLILSLNFLISWLFSADYSGTIANMKKGFLKKVWYLVLTPNNSFLPNF